MPDRRARILAVVLAILVANFLVVVPLLLLQPAPSMDVIQPAASISALVSALSLLALIALLLRLLRAKQPGAETRRQILVRAVVTVPLGLAWGVFKLTQPPPRQPRSTGE